MSASNELVVKVKLLNNLAKAPDFKSDKAAGSDVQSMIDVTIMSGSSALIPIGIAVEPPEGYMLEAVGRSGLGCKNGLRLANCVGIIDNDYRGEIMFKLHNDSDLNYTIRAGDSIGQLLLRRYNQFKTVVVEELSETVRGTGGFGSTGR